MSDGTPLFPSPPPNEPILAYAPGSAERATLKAELARMQATTIDIPMFIDGREVRTGDLVDVRSPHKRSLLLARAHLGGVKHVEDAIGAARAAHGAWAELPLSTRAGVFLKAADLLATRLRPTLNAATMLGQSKTAHQAEIDSACELIDFLRWNAHFAERIASEQPHAPPGVWNKQEPRPLEAAVAGVRTLT